MKREPLLLLPIIPLALMAGICISIYRRERHWAENGQMVEARVASAPYRDDSYYCADLVYSLSDNGGTRTRYCEMSPLVVGQAVQIAVDRTNPSRFRLAPIKRNFRVSQAIAYGVSSLVGVVVLDLLLAFGLGQPPRLAKLSRPAE